MLCLDTDLGVLGSAGGAILFFASSGTGTSPTSRNAISADGITWTEVTPSGGTLESGGNLARATLASDKWIGFLGNRSVTRDGGTAGSSSTGLTTSYSMAFGNGKYVAVGVQGGIFYASYATTLAGSWIKVSLSGLGSSATGSGVDYLNGLFIAVAGDGVVSTSTDGVSWNTRFSGTFTPSDQVAMEYGNGHYVIKGKTGNYLYSNDAITWTLKTISGFSGVNGATIYWNGVWYFFGNTQVFTTTTPQTAASWGGTSITYDGTIDVYNVASSPDKLVIFGVGSGAPKIAYSTNGISWTTASTSASLGINPAQNSATVFYVRA